jgi:hypothetical protein
MRASPTLLLLSLASASLSGCVGVTRQIVHEPNNAECPGRSSAAECPAQQELTRCKQAFEHGQCEGLALAQAYRNAYLRAAGNREHLATSSNLVVLGAAIGGLFYGLTAREAYRDRALRLGSWGVGAYALNQTFAGDVSTLIYLQGASAMECAVLAATPHLMPSVSRDALTRAMRRLNDAISPFANQANTRDNHEDARLLAASHESLRRARQHLAASQRSGMLLSGRIRLLAGEVNRQLVAAQPDANAVLSLAQSFPALVRGLGASTSTTPPAAAAPAADTGNTPPTEATSEDGAAAARAELASAQQEIEALLLGASFDAADFVEVSACVPDAARTVFKVEPEERTVSVQVGATHTFHITDTGGFPSARLSGSNTDAVVLQPITLQGNTYVITLKAERAVGAQGPTLLIAETTGSRVVTVQLIVTAKAAPSP